jgi:hypothetical protein
VTRDGTSSFDLQLDGIVERYVKTAEQQLRMVTSMHQRDLDERLPTFLLACRESIHKTTGTTPTSIVFRRELCLPCELLFGAPPKRSSL